MPNPATVLELSMSSVNDWNRGKCEAERLEQSDRGQCVLGDDRRAYL